MLLTLGAGTINNAFGIVLRMAAVYFTLTTSLRIIMIRHFSIALAFLGIL